MPSFSNAKAHAQAAATGGEGVRTPPSVPKAIDRTRGAALRALFYRDSAVLPPFTVLLNDPDDGQVRLKIFDTPVTSRVIANEAVLQDPMTYRLLLLPLIRKLRAEFGDTASLLITRQGVAYALAYDDAYAATVTGVLPDGVDDGSIQLKVHGWMYQFLTVGTRFANERVPFFRWLGLALAAVVVYATLTNWQLFWDVVIKRAVDAMTYLEPTSAWPLQLKTSVAVMLSLIEVIGVVAFGIKVLRPFLFLAGGIDGVMHMAYGFHEASDQISAVSRGAGGTLAGAGGVPTPVDAAAATVATTVAHPTPLQGVSGGTWEIIYSLGMTFVPELLLAWGILYLWQTKGLWLWAIGETVHGFQVLRNVTVNKDPLQKSHDGVVYERRTVYDAKSGRSFESYIPVGEARPGQSQDQRS